MSEIISYSIVQCPRVSFFSALRVERKNTSLAVDKKIILTYSDTSTLDNRDRVVKFFKIINNDDRVNVM